MTNELFEYDALGLADLIRKGEIEPKELLELTIERIEQLNPKLNAVIHKMYDEARETAERWGAAIKAAEAGNAVFAGVPFLLKDLLAESKGAPFHEGMPGSRRVCLCNRYRIGAATKSRGIDHRREDQYAGVRLSADNGTLDVRTDGQSLGPESDTRRVQRRIRSGGGRGNRPHGARQ